jgi:hypothetical protein
MDTESVIIWNNPIYTVAYLNGVFYAGGSTGKLATSVNGTASWTQRTSSFGSSVILGLAYSSTLSIYIAVGGDGKLATSSDGLTWTQRTSSFGTTFIRGVVAFGGTLVAVGDDGKLATSTMVLHGHSAHRPLVQLVSMELHRLKSPSSLWRSWKDSIISRRNQLDSRSFKLWKL